jgi:uncharacterized PurR-regulated membrane protein YhhQ (DUF165 family)
VTRAPNKWAQSHAEIIRTIASIAAASGTAYLVLKQAGVL